VDVVVEAVDAVDDDVALTAADGVVELLFSFCCTAINVWLIKQS
jgi:hypothetical protein